MLDSASAQLFYALQERCKMLKLQIASMAAEQDILNVWCPYFTYL